MKMRKPGLVLFLSASFIALSSMVCSAAGTPKIGYFEFQAVLQNSRVGKQSGEELKRQGDELRGDVDKKAKAFKAAKDDFDNKKSMMDEKAKDKKLKELQEMQQDGEKAIMEFQNQMNKLNAAMGQPIVDKILEIVKKIGREDKYDFIFEREKAGMVFGNDKDDLTKRVIDGLDKSGIK